jgi:uncharacterized damage-inducible protein DinB
MTVDRGFVAENHAERARLQTLVTRLDDADLARPMPAGWTVAAVLAHLAFWDQRLLILLEHGERLGSAAMPEAVREADIDWINDAAKPLMLALPPRTAAHLAVSIADTLDRTIEALPDDFLARNAAAGTPLYLNRANHRGQHLDEIERAFRVT